VHVARKWTLKRPGETIFPAVRLNFWYLWDVDRTPVLQDENLTLEGMACERKFGLGEARNESWVYRLPRAEA